MTPITINTNHRHSTAHGNHNNRDDIPLLSAAVSNTSDPNKYASSTLNPDASSFTFSFSPSNHYQQTRMNNQKNISHDNTCSTSDYYSQSGLPSSGSSSVRSAASLSPSILSAISPSMLLQDESPTEDPVSYRRENTAFIDEKRLSTGSSLNLFIGDKILNLYGSTGSANFNSTSLCNVDMNNNQAGVTNSNLHDSNSTSVQFDSKSSLISLIKHELIDVFLSFNFRS